MIREARSRPSCVRLAAQRTSFCVTRSDSRRDSGVFGKRIERRIFAPDALAAAAPHLRADVPVLADWRRARTPLILRLWPVVLWVSWLT